MTDTSTWTELSSEIQDVAIGLDLTTGDLIELFAKLRDAKAADSADAELLEAAETFKDAIINWMLERGYLNVTA